MLLFMCLFCFTTLTLDFFAFIIPFFAELATFSGGPDAGCVPSPGRRTAEKNCADVCQLPGQEQAGAVFLPANAIPNFIPYKKSAFCNALFLFAHFGKA